ncbi:hypothetical protein BKA58DRAFT_163344 [Alternaria rosae]|uniref:uncharacterized protein n=1 Tax=Alternaria rosae TaxID=1187941 RepID=UPI001E8D88A5|nr:uncharacterized protein BKA58DRAFT_163344 [Alternaria rosae]KAH6873236.1 hypothetical protein BKA58DRAFT_163344 [Alternaria rosae]
MPNEYADVLALMLEERRKWVEQYPLHDSDCEIHTAAYKGDIALITSILENDTTATADIDARNWNNCTPLHLAIRADRGSVVRLLEYGAELDAMNQQGRTPLLNSVANVTYASEFRFSPTVCNLLLEKGAEKTLSNAEGKTMVEIVNDSHSWIFGEEGRVQKKPPPVHVAPSRGRGRGRGAGDVANETTYALSEARTLLEHHHQKSHIIINPNKNQL